MEDGTVARRRKSSCCVCDGEDLVQIIDLPDFPLTGIYLEAHTEDDFQGVDQSLMLCQECGHGQLLDSIDPSYLYGSSYVFRSSESPTATEGNNFFTQFFEKVTEGQTFKRIVEIGCNDLYLLNNIAHKGSYLIGIDPIWKGKEPQPTEKIRVIGRFVEEVDFVGELGGVPEVILSAHTFEHIDDPKGQLIRLMQSVDEGALFIIEVPGFDCLLTNCRFDQVFHQHLQYFSLASFRRMIDEIGGEYLSHTFNYQYWGGTMLVAFTKAGGKRVKSESNGLVAPSVKVVTERYGMFRDQLAGLMKVIGTIKHRPIYGYGAALMVPALAYHLNSDLSFLECILDDNPDRNGLTYPHLPVWIRHPEDGMDLQKATALITALDHVRPILRRLIPMRPRQILAPVNVL